MGVKEGVLHELVGVLVSTNVAPHDRGEQGRVSTEELLEGRGIAIDIGLEQDSVCGVLQRARSNSDSRS